MILMKNDNKHVVYWLVHGFPGDESVGFILLGNGLYKNITTVQSNNCDVNLIGNWFNSITQNSYEFPDDYWY